MYSQLVSISCNYLFKLLCCKYLTLEPQPPTNLQVGNILPTAASITWSISSPDRTTPWSVVFNYKIIVTEFTFGLPNFVANTSSQSYTFTTLEEFSNYTVVVAAENTIGISTFSTRFNFSTPQAGKCVYTVNMKGLF